MKKLLITGVAASALVLPVVAFAQTFQTLGGILGTIGALIAYATPIVVALALLAFFWGLAMYIFGVSSEETRKKGLQIMLWGIIALFVMVAVWGIIQVLINTFGLGGAGGGAPVPFIDQFVPGNAFPGFRL